MAAKESELRGQVAAARDKADTATREKERAEREVAAMQAAQREAERDRKAALAEAEKVCGEAQSRPGVMNRLAF